MEENTIKEITFVDVDKGKISSFFKKRMEQKGVNITKEREKVSEFVSLIPHQPSWQIQDLQKVAAPFGSHQPSNDPNPSNNTSTRDMVAKMLEGYDEITQEELLNIPTGTRLKYITYCPEKGPNGLELFRQGGYLRSIKPNHVVLAGLYRNVYNKRYRVNRYVYDPRDKTKLLYITRFFIKSDENPRSPSTSSVHVLGGSKDELSTEAKEGQGEDNGFDTDIQTHIDTRKASSFQRMIERVMKAKEDELSQLNERVNQLRERDERRQKFYA